MRNRPGVLLFALAFLVASTASSQHFREYTLPVGSGPTSITIAGDGTPWFTETTANKIGYISTLGSVIHKTIPTANSAPWGIAARGNFVFFTEANTGGLGYVTATSAVTDGGAPAPLTTPHEIVYEGNYRFWVADAGGNQIHALDLVCFIGCSFSATVGTVPTATSGPEALTVGPDGQVWFTELNTGKIGYAFDNGITTTVSFTEYNGGAVTSQPQGIALGPDGTLYFTEKGANKIGRMSSAGAMITEYAIPTPNSQPHSIVRGPRGDLYFTEEAGNKIGRLAVDGTIAEFTIPTPNSGPTGIAVDGYGSVWFTEKAASKIGVISFVRGDENADGALDVLDLMYLINYFFAGGAAPL